MKKRATLSKEKCYELPAPQSPSVIRPQIRSGRASFEGKPELNGNTSPYALHLANSLGVGRAELHGTSNVPGFKATVMEKAELEGNSPSQFRQADSPEERKRELRKLTDLAELDGTSKEKQLE